jgi:hypothetical protein
MAALSKASAVAAPAMPPPMIKTDGISSLVSAVLGSWMLVSGAV